MKVGLVLGAGGLVGGAWLAAGLQALAEETGWDPAEAEYLVGTSAGSIAATLLAARRPFSSPELGSGDTASPPWAPPEIIELSPFRLHGGLPRFGLGSWSLAFATTARPYRHTPAALYSAWLPAGIFSTEGLSATIRQAAPQGFDAHPNLWVVACDHATGRRVAFGREGAPPAALPQAVAASCAIPGTYRSVEIAGRHYVDGGMYSTSNLDLLRDQDLDLAICLNPTSTRDLPSGRGPLDLMANAVRRQSGRRLGSEAKKLRARGTDVVLVQPGAEDLAVMGANLMSPSVARRRRVVEVARRTVAEQLRGPKARELLAELPRRSSASRAGSPRSGARVRTARPAPPDRAGDR